jgi:autonomous glycyl radical cofactor GrcA
MEAFSATLERRLQLTVRTLGHAVRTPSGILIITFYSNIKLGRNQRRWKADKKYCQLTIRKATRNVRKDPVRTEIFARPDGPAENSRITFRTRKT